MGFSEAQEELVLRSWKAMKKDAESIALKFFFRCGVATDLCFLHLRRFLHFIPCIVCIMKGPVVRSSLRGGWSELANLKI